MEFPTIETFEQNKEQSTPIIKWRDLPINTIFHVKSVEKIETPASHFGPGMAMYAELKDGDGNTFKTWLPTRLCVELKDYGWRERTAYVKSLGLQPSKRNPTRSYYDYDIYWVNC